MQGSRSVDPVGDDVGTRQRAADDRVPDQCIADLAEHPLGLPDACRIDLGAQRHQERAEQKAHDGDDDRELDEGEALLTPGTAGPAPGRSPAGVGVVDALAALTGSSPADRPPVSDR